jgi:hypothetical protein
MGKKGYCSHCAKTHKFATFYMCPHGGLKGCDICKSKDPKKKRGWICQKEYNIIKKLIQTKTCEDQSITEV